MQQQTFIRTAKKAGSWYTNQAEVLEQELGLWKKNATKSGLNELQKQKVKAIIGPHAGLSYCGATGAWGYQFLEPRKNLRVFLLGPSHHYSMYGCGLTQFHQFETPLGNISIDQKTISHLRQKSAQYCRENYLQEFFQDLNSKVDEAEHSLELHLPWIQYQLRDQPFTLVPIMVGQTAPEVQEHLGKILAEYFDDENTVFVISSDFCHWGERFNYQYFQKSDGHIWQSIEQLDRKAMQIIENQDVYSFDQYLQNTKNTICGRRPIGILLNIIKNSSFSNNLKTQFLHYSQSSQCMSKSDSSVSYAASVTYIN